ncbi:FAD-dependent oxidoreductase [Sulfobacillus harzensis]|uniref:FAD-dependent oxidoreductase n=1 Tax=Sulfobacillus harzensis TaxID=2729629 RepID=A0A7Y0Q2E4_9FIRM|nr:FAD-dependent oxidoreductase [Sulfobacillus harzensis]NMP22250.1 FAD-dependent oxidoreductase [Sulfobacillus harzensis]
MVVVVGGGASGLGTAWDLLLRGIPVTVVEAEDIGRGTSGRFHGLLHSGGRYVVSDPRSARECREENDILRRIAPSAIEPTGGYFVGVGDQDTSYIDEWLKGADQAGIPVRPVSRKELEEKVPGIRRESHAAYFVPDGVLEGFTLLTLLKDNIEKAGGTILPNTRLEAVRHTNGRVSGVSVSTRNGVLDINCNVVVNAAGPWASDVAHLFDDGFSMQRAAGMMLIFANRMVPQVVNRLAPPGDGDIFVPHGETVILGTTDVPQDSPEAPVPTRAEARRLLALGSELFPAIESWRVLRAFCGVRPLFQKDVRDVKSRYVSRDFSVIDHGARHGLEGAFSLVGGKWTTYRLMAESVGDEVCMYLGVDTASITASTALSPVNRPGPAGGPLVCECEGVTRDSLASRMDWSVDDWRTGTWFAMGPCQGTMCAHRAIALRTPRYGPEHTLGELARLREERDKGMWPVAWGDNAREAVFNRAVRFQTLAEEAGSDEWE